MLTCMVYFLSLQKENPSFSQGGSLQNLILWKKQHLTLTEKTCKAITLLLMKDSRFEYPSLTLVCTVIDSSTTMTIPSCTWKDVCCMIYLSLFSHYSYLPINIILSLSLHWEITCWVLLHTPGRQFSFQAWHLLLQDDWQGLSGRDGVTPGKRGVSCLTTLLCFHL